MGRVREKLLWLLLSSHCDYCGKLLEEGKNLCEECEKELPRITGKRCRRCGAGRDRCSCRGRKVQYDAVISPFYYEKGIKECIRRLKFKGRDYAARVLARDMYLCFLEEYKDIDFDFITYVPFTSAQKISRLYNQSELLAQRLSELTSIPCEDVMVKLFDTGSQHSTGRKLRRGNVFGVYDVREKASVESKTILLVDDVRTTGATLSECAAILKIRGAGAVYCITAAVTAAQKTPGIDKS